VVVVTFIVHPSAEHGKSTEDYDGGTRHVPLTLLQKFRGPRYESPSEKDNVVASSDVRNSRTDLGYVGDAVNRTAAAYTCSLSGVIKVYASRFEHRLTVITRRHFAQAGL